jgi:hypothetical protein
MKQLLINPLQKISRTSFVRQKNMPDFRSAKTFWHELSPAGEMCLAAAAANVGHLTD